MGISCTTAILDVGGLPHDWISLGYRGQVICVSLSPLREGAWGEGNILYYRQDATALPYRDDAFDVIYSNSLLEHVGWENQSRVASEISRVGKRYWVQAPNRSFPLEPHYRALFFYQLPMWLRRFVAQYWTPIVRRTNYYLQEVETIHPPSFREMQALFPEATIFRETVMGLTKAFIAVSNHG